MNRINCTAAYYFSFGYYFTGAFSAVPKRDL